MATCSSADSVLEAARLIKANGELLNDFVNGESDQTVQLGASTDTPTPTLRNLVANALEHVAESMGDSVETAIATINELESGKADKVSGNVEDHIAALDMYGNLQDSRIDMGDVATISVDIANLDTDKADKVSSATNGHFAGLNASGNLTDSGKSPADITALENGKTDKVSSATNGHIAGLNSSGNLTDSGIASSDVALKSTDIATLQAIKANKVTGATAGDIAILNASGDLVDSGVKPADKADKVANAVAGNFAGLDATGNLTDSGRSPDDITALEEAVDSLEERKANRPYAAVNGNLAELDSFGDLRDAGHAIEDLVLLLAYANGEALELTWQNRMAIARYDDWVDEEAERHRRDMDRIASAGVEAMQVRQSIRDLIDAFDESVAQHRLQTRLFDGTNPDSSSKPVLFVICGQSNAVGAGEYAPFDSATDCGQFWSWKDGADALKPIKDPTGNYTDRGSGWPAFARRFFALTGRKVILLNVACGGSAVTDGGYDTTSTWADNGYGTLRSRTQTVWNAFSAAVPASSYDMGAILWVQGETEVGRLYDGTVTLSDYLGTWSNLSSGTRGVLQWLRNLIGEESCPIFIGRTGYSSAALTNPTSERYYRMVSEAQEQLYDYETVFPGFSLAPRYLDAWDVYMKGTIHYSPLGYSIQGKSFARSVVNFLNF